MVDKITLEDYIKFYGIEFEVIEGLYWHEGSNREVTPTIQLLKNLRDDYKQLGNPLE